VPYGTPGARRDKGVFMFESTENFAASDIRACLLVWHGGGFSNMNVKNQTGKNLQKNLKNYQKKKQKNTKKA